MIGKLIINGISVPVLKEIPVSTNLAISDIKEPDKRGGSTTKTIIVPRTGETDLLFDSIYDVNIEQSTFNPNVKIEATYYLNELEQFVGDLQLLKYKDDKGLCDYECSIVGREAGIFVAVGDALLTDIDMSNLDHTFNKTEQKNSWATSYRKSGVATAFAYGEGYVYPFINYGYALSDASRDVNHFKPAIAVREYLLRMYAAQGFTWETGGFFDQTFFKHLYIPCNRDKIELSNADISNSQYFIGKTTPAPVTYVNGNTLGNSAVMNSQFLNPNYDLETGSYFDASNQYDSVTNFYSTILNTGYYNVVGYVQFDVTVDAASLPGGTWVTQAGNQLNTIIEKDTGSGWVMIANVVTVFGSTTHNLGSAKSFSGSAQSGNYFLPTGTKIRVRAILSIGPDLFDAAAAPAPNNTPFTSTYIIPNGTQKNEHYLLRADTSVYDGNTLTMNNTIPVNIKQKDFLKAIINMFNIYSEKDKDKPNNYIQESRDAFFNGTAEIWTDKLDTGKSWEAFPMKELDAINYIWKYKDDKDYYNDLYQKQFTDNYGLKRHQVASDFIKGEKKTEIIFSPTPLVSNSANNIICPHIYSKDASGNTKPLSHNIRILYYGGLKNSGAAWNYTSLSGTTSETQYPYIGHLDDPFAPTIDLNFYYPQQVYFTYPLAYMTTNNLYNAYYSKFINEITDRDSKIIVCWIRLDEVDIKNFTFRKPVFIRHDEYGAGYYIVNKIFDYDPLTEETTKVELLKLKRYDAFVPSTIAIDVGSNTSSTARIPYNPVANVYGNSEIDNTIVVGSSSRVLGSGCSATGPDNFIDATSSKSFLINCSGCSIVGAENLTVIGATNRAFDSTYNNQTINDSEVGNTKVKSLTVTADFTIDKDVSLYYVDVQGGSNITAMFDFTTDANRTITFKRIDANVGFFKIDEVGGTATVDGNAIPYDTLLPQYGTLKLGNNGTDFFIL